MGEVGRPIGVFDSGMGGLSVAREIRRLLPAEDILYLADTAHCPYGGRAPADIRALAHAAAAELIGRGAKLVVIACNTASVTALAQLRRDFVVPFVGIVPAVKPAAATSQARRVGILATPATLDGVVFADLVRTFAADVTLIGRACPGWVDLVERGLVHGPMAEAEVMADVAPLIASGVDTLVLGCTHYSFLRPLIEQIAGPGVAVLDAGEPVARQVARVLATNGLGRCQPGGRFDCLTTAADTPTFAATASRLLGFSIDTAESIRLEGRV